MNVEGPAGRSRTPLTIGWEAAKANAVPGFVLQAAMLGVLLAYYFNQRFAGFLNAAAALKERNPVLAVIGAGILAGAILPELFVVYFFQKGRWQRQNFRNLVFTVPTWAIDAVLVSLMYRVNAFWFGDVVTLPVVLAKICVDQFGYNPFFAAPAEVLVYEWKNEGISLASVRRALTWTHYREKIVPTLLATWAVWGPLAGDYLFAAVSGAVPALQPGFDLLGPASDLHDQPIFRQNGSGRDAFVRGKGSAVGLIRRVHARSRAVRQISGATTTRSSDSVTLTSDEGFLGFPASE